MTDADARIEAALSALKAGKNPPCPWCGDAHCDPDADRQGACWGCRSELDVYGQDRGHACYERQLAAQAAEIARLRELLRELVQAIDEGDIYNDKLIEAARDAAKEGA